jgi:sortase A
MKKIKTLLVGVLFLAGLSLLLYPLVANRWNDYRQSRLISQYEETVAEAAADGSTDYTAEWEKANAYNEELSPTILPDSFAIAEGAQQVDEIYMSCLNLNGDGMMGYVEIPKIRIQIPLYHTTGEDVLQKGAGHLMGSSLPVGGEGTHSVIAAHRGLPSASLFTDLDKLELGDHFILHILGEELYYEVDQINVVEPDETDLLRLEDGKDLVTLLTCTPYGVNSHRLLVRGHRIEQLELKEEETSQTSAATSYHTNYLFWVLVGLAVTGLYILIIILRQRRDRKRRKDRIRGTR